MKGNQSGDVDAFLAALDHPLKPAIEEVRDTIRGASEGITEHIKWNAPSFCYGGDDRVTMRLHPPTRVQIIFHRGAKVKDNSDRSFVFADESGLIKWAASDRGVVTFESVEDARAAAPALRELVRRWIEATV